MADGENIFDDLPVERSMPISDGDIYAVVGLIGRVAGLTAPMNDRRRILLDGLCELIDADLWMWSHSQWREDMQRVPLNLLDAGWHSEQERNRMLQIAARSDVNASMLGGALPQTHATLIFDQSHPGWIAGEVYRNAVAPMGLEHLMVSLYPMERNVISVIGIHRRRGKRAFGERERALTHLVLSQIDWLHRIDLPAIAADTPLAALSNRERELLLHLLSGEGRKQIAAKMGLTENTIGGYMKSLYRRLSVNSRGELMSKFLPTNVDDRDVKDAS